MGCRPPVRLRLAVLSSSSCPASGTGSPTCLGFFATIGTGDMAATRWGMRSAARERGCASTGPRKRVEVGASTRRSVQNQPGAPAWRCADASSYRHPRPGFYAPACGWVLTPYLSAPAGHPKPLRRIVGKSGALTLCDRVRGRALGRDEDAPEVNAPGGILPKFDQIWPGQGREWGVDCRGAGTDAYVDVPWWREAETRKGSVSTPRVDPTG